MYLADSTELPPVRALHLIREIGHGAPDISWQEWMMFETYAEQIAHPGDFFIISCIEFNSVTYTYIIHRLAQTWVRIITNEPIGTQPHEPIYTDIIWHRDYAEEYTRQIYGDYFHAPAAAILPVELMG
jgi:hypothetical protein